MFKLDSRVYSLLRMEPTQIRPKILRYIRLDQQTQEIRLLILDHGGADADIICHLIHTTLGNHPPYKALSYSWDEVKVLYPIDVDGYQFGIGPNLKAALQSIRHPKEPRYLWVDAICINQRDMAERNCQVTMMHWIYQLAVQVIVWLGKKTVDSDRAMDVLEDENFKDRIDLFPAVDNDADLVKYTATDMATWKAIGHFYARTYWCRVWVVQEVVWAADVIVMCGRREMSWNSLLNSSLHLYRQRSLVTSNNWTTNTLMEMSGISFIFDMADVRARRIGSLPLSLGPGLARVRIRKSTDPRDRIFGILNILPLNERPCLPDYSKNVIQVFAEVAKSMIEKSHRLKLLAACEHPWLPIEREDHLRKRVRFPVVPGLPSWTPNWTAPRLSIPLHGGYDSNSILTFTASRESIADFKVSGDMTTLCVRGFAFDIVEVSDGPLAITPAQTREPRLFDRLEHVAFHHRPMNSLYTGRMSRLEAFCRALTLDRTYDGNSFDSDAVMHYLQWRNGSRDYFTNAHLMLKTCGGRFFFCSSKGYIGFGPQGTTAGDLLSVIHGCHVPIVLRRRPAYYLAGGNRCHDHEDFRSCLLSGCPNNITSWEQIEEHYIVIGEAYVQGVMNGELMPKNGLHASTRIFPLR